MTTLDELAAAFEGLTCPLSTGDRLTFQLQAAPGLLVSTCVVNAPDGAVCGLTSYEHALPDSLDDAAVEAFIAGAKRALAVTVQRLEHEFGATGILVQDVLPFDWLLLRPALTATEVEIALTDPGSRAGILAPREVARFAAEHGLEVPVDPDGLQIVHQLLRADDGELPVGITATNQIRKLGREDLALFALAMLYDALDELRRSHAMGVEGYAFLADGRSYHHVVYATLAPLLAQVPPAWRDRARELASSPALAPPS